VRARAVAVLSGVLEWDRSPRSTRLPSLWPAARCGGSPVRGLSSIRCELVPGGLSVRRGGPPRADGPEVRGAPFPSRGHRAVDGADRGSLPAGEHGRVGAHRADLGAAGAATSAITWLRSGPRAGPRGRPAHRVAAPAAAFPGGGDVATGSPFRPPAAAGDARRVPSRWPLTVQGDLDRRRAHQRGDGGGVRPHPAASGGP
jgi:hypothetical protein